MSNSMINPSIVDLLEKVDNRYSLVIVTSKRARQIIDGAEPYVKVDSNKPLTVSINEVNDGFVKYEQIKEGLK
ncbi:MULTISPECIES: DNA-directed RNA polymerase subunit omega [Clostridium]|uniref:DNA-directed RNA polymerase subunit omega n=4 Tax=Clostridium TaxID=1485 RepID=A0A6V8SFJ1_9CLOT|nr:MULTISPECIES: DNA-directed RNA polymerase subunit omega [Clostridium]MBK1810605.1 DNA-directed RNA polymerase subunit omega [Clostridium yunnanense]GFP75989.1 DNA-directed RNA polymerase subunit omega [Clostridium fungisolvens]GFZ29692.1 DNA-directed RNA polymerase subunit omega [Clostridium zeae]GKU24812.1 DNA-directed RNA polymerase subunit omega [Clostridium folliculivorans]GKU30910.1 DNA-directed RNA polymerase subunit omega [Clostridium folliculivorans]